MYKYKTQGEKGNEFASDREIYLSIYALRGCVIDQSTGQIKFLT